ncbi:snRNA-activating protein complex subunit 4 [Indicator indicator]|uniref:snRNA-activating protein complex subunit 4 n=1 Tax=Indicator indicator TaxID=1002788 RepID=UPI0023DF6FE3|nr:snRNA-activating protein complex subunit 4 [Indicator indicator]
MSRWTGPAGARSPPAMEASLSPAALDLNAEREKIRREIEELERSLEPGGANIEMAVSDCSLSSGTDDDEDDDSDSPAEMEMEREDESSDDDTESSLPQDPETCLQMNHVYQEVIQEKLGEVELLIAQNREQQKELMCELSGPKIAKAGDGRNLPANIFLGHFMKPYFKDKTTGIGPPSNEDTKEKAAQGIKSFEQLISTKWKSREKTLLQKSVVSDRLQRLLQPKLLKMSYWNQKLEKVKTETEKQILEKQIKEVEKEIEAINKLPESDLLGSRFDEHDWEKISNIHFDGQRSSDELRKFWQNWEHPSINKKEWTEEEIQKLKNIASKHHYLDWQTIAQELGTNRTPFQCLQKYQVYNKDLKRKEWTRSEDQMLLELVQEMRVGSHIPYKKIAYYMEGRDSAQLIYRWTKSVDPSLKKGPWTPEEDAMLLAAVKKYGERDWYKIRTEVPGRSDAQCRDRYLKALHYDVKKGKWSLREEEQLIELVQKHGLGRWSKIASELPHRTGSQCLSKWKLMIGSKKKKHRPTKRQHVEESSSSSESSSEDIELDLSDSSEEETTSKEEKSAFPSIDLWVPTRTDTQESNKGRYQTPSLFSPVSAEAQSSSSVVPRAACDGDKDSIAGKSSELNTLLRGIARPHSTDVIVKNPAEVLSKASRCGKQVLRVTLEDVRRVLRHNTCFQRKLILKPPASLTKLSGGCTPGQKPQGLQNITEKAFRQERERLRRMNLDRKLLMAVTPWVGNVLLPCTLQTGKLAFRQTKADAIQEKIKSVSLVSTPLFTLLIQLFQIDTNGCMKIIRERKMRQAELLRANARRPQQASQNMETSSGNSSQPCTQRSSQRGIPRNAVRRPVALKVRESSAAASESSTPATQGALPAQVQRQKPKTVSELLREKRLRESRAKKAMERTVFVAPQVLVSGPLIIQSPPQQIIPSAQAGSKPAAVGCTNSQVQCAPAPLPAFTSVAGSTSTTAVLENHSSSVPETGKKPGSLQGTEVQSSKEIQEQALESSAKGGVNPAASEKLPNQGGCNGQVLAGSSASVVLQNQAFVPHQITVLPVGIDSGTNKLSLSAPVTCELSSNGPQQRAVSLLPAIVTPQTASHLIPNSILPFTWVVTPQALLPTAVQTVVGVPQGLPAAAVRSPSQTAVISNGNVSSSAAPPVPAGVNLPQPSSAETEAPSAQSAAGVPLARTANHATAVLPVTSASPGCATTATASSAAPVCSGGFSKASDSSAAQTAPPADAPSLCAVLLPQPQLPASTQGIDSQGASSLTSLGKSHDSSTTSNPSIVTKGIRLQPGNPVPCNSVPRNSDGFAAQAVKNRPIASKPPSTQPADGPAQPTTSSAEKNLLDFSLISLEPEGLVKEWLSGKQGVQVPSLQTRLPYLPPFLCNLKTLSKLLLQKAALEEQAAHLLPSGASQAEGTGVDLQAIGELVQQKLGDNPAYLLLKARFLAAFTLPAVLATLPPPKVTTTLSTSRKQYEESDEEEWQSEKEVPEEESDGNESTGEQSDRTAGDAPGSKDTDLLHQGLGAEENAAQSALASCTDVADGSAPQIRRSARFRKRRRI